MTTREQQEQDANDFLETFGIPGKGNVAEQAEVSKALVTRFKLTRAEVAGILGISESAVRRRLDEYANLVAKNVIPTGKYPDAQASDPVQDEHNRLDRNDIRAETRALIEKTVIEDRIAAKIAPYMPSKSDLRHVDDLARELRKGRFRVKGEEEASILTISDWHKGLENHLYNDDIADRVLMRYVEKSIRLTELHRSQCRVRKCYLILDGDNIQGSSGNFPAQRWTARLTAVDQATELYCPMMIKVIEMLLVEYDEVVVVCMPGNHGQLYLKKASVEPEHANIEHVAHKMIRLAFRSSKRVTFRITDEWYQVSEFMGVPGLITHGHSIPGAGSLDGIKSSLRKLADVLPPYKFSMFGHFHSPSLFTLPTPHASDEPRYGFVNGTAIRGDDHSIKYGAAHGNAWWTMFVNSKRLTAQYPVSLYT